MTLSERLRRLGALARGLSEADLGYPPGENRVRPSIPSSEVILRLNLAGLAEIPSLGEFYCACNGFGFPDVHIGCIFKTFDQLLDLDPNVEPYAMDFGDELIPVLPIGSTGGGDLIVLERDRGRLLLLPPGGLRDGYYDNADGRASVLADGIPPFLDRLEEEIASIRRLSYAGHD